MGGRNLLSIHQDVGLVKKERIYIGQEKRGLIGDDYSRVKRSLVFGNDNSGTYRDPFMIGVSLWIQSV